MFVIHLRNLRTSNEIIDKNLGRIRLANHQAQQIQKTNSSIDNVIDWKVDDSLLVADDLRQQFLMKSRTKRMPMNSDPRASPRERVPLATTDFGVSLMPTTE